MAISVFSKRLIAWKSLNCSKLSACWWSSVPCKFAAHVMGVRFKGKGECTSSKKKINVDTNYYVNDLLEDCRYLLGNNFVFQLKGATACGQHNTRLAC